MREYADFLRSKGLTTPEIMYLVSIRSEGEAMTKAIYKFNELYDLREIDGFADSAIKVLGVFYGKRLKAMKPQTLREKVARLMGCIECNVDKEHVFETVEYYLNN
jgi:hypothetical protein